MRGKRIWLTRPEQQNDALARSLRARGADVFSLPLIEIVAVPPDAETRALLAGLDRFELVFYISANAARIGLQTISAFWPDYPRGPANFAIGPATARVIKQRGIEVLYPTRQADSEHLLALPQLRQVAGKRALIVRGVGGLETLARGLRARGCSVEYAEVYGRCLPAHPPALMQQALHNHEPDAIVISSAEAMDNLRTLFAPWHGTWQELPLFVSSERLARYGGKSGFRNISTLAGATDLRVLRSLETAFKGNRKPALRRYR